MFFFKNAKKFKNKQRIGKKKSIILLKYYKKPEFSYKQKKFLKGLDYSKLSELEKNYIFKKYFAYKYHKVIADKILEGPTISFNEINKDQALLYYMLWKYRFVKKKIIYGLYTKRITRLPLWKKKLSISANWRRLKKMKLFRWFRFKYNNLKYYLYLLSKPIKKHRFKNKKRVLRQKSNKKFLVFLWYFKSLQALSSGLFSADNKKKERRLRAYLMSNLSNIAFFKPSGYSKKNIRSFFYKYKSFVSFLKKQEYLKRLLYIRQYYERILNEKREWSWKLEKFKLKRHFHQKICARFFFKKFFLVSSLKISNFRKSLWFKRKSLNKMLHFLEFHKNALFKSFGWIKNYRSYKNIVKRKACFVLSNKNFLITKKFLSKQVVYKFPINKVKKQFKKFSKLVEKKNDFVDERFIKDKKRMYALLNFQKPFFLKLKKKYNKYNRKVTLQAFLVKKIKAFKALQQKSYFFYYRSFNLRSGFTSHFYKARFKKLNKKIKYSPRNFFKNSSYLKIKWPQKYHKINSQAIVLLLKIRAIVNQKIKIKDSEPARFKIIPRSLLYITRKNYKKLRDWYSFRKSIRYIKRSKWHRKRLGLYKIYIKDRRYWIWRNLRRPSNILYKSWTRFMFKKINKILNYSQRSWIDKWSLSKTLGFFFLKAYLLFHKRTKLLLCSKNQNNIFSLNSFKNRIRSKLYYDVLNFSYSYLRYLRIKFLFKRKYLNTENFLIYDNKSHTLVKEEASFLYKDFFETTIKHKYQKVINILRQLENFFFRVLKKKYNFKKRADTKVFNELKKMCITYRNFVLFFNLNFLKKQVIFFIFFLIKNNLLLKNTLSTHQVFISNKLLSYFIV